MPSEVTDRIQVSAFYLFKTIIAPSDFQMSIKRWLEKTSILGTVLVASEGVNGTISGIPDEVEAFMVELAARLEVERLPYKRAFCESQPFHRMKVRLKNEIVTLGVEGIDPTSEVGEYVKPEDWNALIEQEDVTVVDTRNEYEYSVGTFKGAIDPKTTSFRDFPEYVKNNLDPDKTKKVAMFCTGGIRCEKATAYMLKQGFKEVYHLQGGILEYLNKVPKEASMWEGECFVFDDRVTVDHDLQKGSYAMCHACRMPLNEEDRTSDAFVEGISCPYCIGHTSSEKKERLKQRQLQMELAKTRNEKHLGGKHPRHRFDWVDEVG
jgi:UPF0176 protein